MTMRLLSMSSTRKRTSSLRRMPVEYNVIRMVRALQIAGVDQTGNFLRA
jgi:hypothetical protein